jgi:uncharacterized lipoprotein YmbA
MKGKKVKKNLPKHLSLEQQIVQQFMMQMGPSLAGMLIQYASRGDDVMKLLLKIDRLHARRREKLRKALAVAGMPIKRK